MNADFLSPDTKAGKLRRHVLELYRQHQKAGTIPTSARFLYYELIAANVISKEKPEVKEGCKMTRRTDQCVIDALTKLRETIDPKTGEAYIPWDAIEDETRQLEDYRASETIAAGMRKAWENARLDLWYPDLPPIILCESRSLLGALRGLAYEYTVPIASTNGQCAGFLHTTIAPELKTDQVILYLGDLDFGGGHIEANTRDVLEKYSDLMWERVAVTPEQVKEFHLVTIPKRDARDGKRHPAVETEALGQTRIVQLLRDRLDDLLPPGRAEDVQERQNQQREAIGIKLGYLEDVGE